jgi:hypothetical protein
MKGTNNKQRIIPEALKYFSVSEDSPLTSGVGGKLYTIPPCNRRLQVYEAEKNKVQE